MTSKEVREKYLKFFESKGHIRIPPAPLVLENDPTTLFTSSGMQPLVPYLMGEPHPSGSKRLVDSQPSIRTVDIDEVGDNRHLTFFEMLGNWSLGDYFKEEQLSWVLEFFNKELDLEKEKLWVSVFEGNDQVPKDEDSVKIWKKLGIPDSRIFFYDAKKNWWSRTGTPQQMPVGEIGGPDSEVFYDFGEELKLHENSMYKDDPCHPNCDCGRYLEIGNSVFIQYKKVGENKLEELPNKNVDFGGGLERVTAAVNGNPDIYKTDLFSSLTKEIEKITPSLYEDNIKIFRIIADHIKASCFLMKAGVIPDNKKHGYVLRRLIRRSAIKIQELGTLLSPKTINSTFSLVREVVKTYPQYFHKNDFVRIESDLGAEIDKFANTIHRGMQVLISRKDVDAKVAFDLYQSYGFPLEVTEELLAEKGQVIDKKQFEEEFEKHRDLSRTTSAGVFKGGLADHSPEVVKLHTATHVLLASLRKVLGDHVVQKGQNITKERSRFDFPHPNKLTDEELKKVENTINDVIKKDLPVNFKIMPKGEAEKTGAIHAFNEKYADTVKVYTIGPSTHDVRSGSPFSREFCGGPHVTHTGEIGRVKIKKQEKIGSGVIRIYIVIE